MMGDLSIPANRGDAEREANALRATAALIRKAAEQLDMIHCPAYAAQCRDLATNAEAEAKAIDEALASARFAPRDNPWRD